MACIRNCRLCNRLILSQDLVYDPTEDALQVNLPANSYGNGERYCIVIAQSIPDDTTVNAQVVFTIGADDTTTYPFINRNGTPIYASQLRTRTIYPTVVNTAVETGVFRYVGNRCLPSNSTTTIQALPVPTTTTVPGGKTDSGSSASNVTTPKVGDK